MNETPDCERFQPSLAEVATGAATGYDRAEVLRHAAGCATCRHELAELTRVADELLLLAPEHEPPAGFEAAVAQRIANLTQVDRRRGRRRFERTRVGGQRSAGPGRPHRARLRLVASIVALLLAAAGGAASALWRTSPDRALGEQYRQTLTIAGGQYFKAAQVTTAGGQVVGHVFLYQGTPSWVTVVLTAAPEPGDYLMSIVTVDGIRYLAGVCPVTGQSGTTAYALAVPVARIAAIELARPGVRLTALPS